GCPASARPSGSTPRPAFRGYRIPSSLQPPTWSSSDWGTRARRTSSPDCAPSCRVPGSSAAVPRSTSSPETAAAHPAGCSAAAWERSLREIFTAHAEAIHRAGLDDEEAALADEREIEMVDAEIYGSERRAAR